MEQQIDLVRWLAEIISVLFLLALLVSFILIVVLYVIDGKAIST